MTIPHSMAVLCWFVSWVAIFACLALYGTIWLVASALRLVVGQR